MCWVRFHFAHSSVAAVAMSVFNALMCQCEDWLAASSRFMSPHRSPTMLRWALRSKQHMIDWLSHAKHTWRNTRRAVRQRERPTHLFHVVTTTLWSSGCWQLQGCGQAGKANQRRSERSTRQRRPFPTHDSERLETSSSIGDPRTSLQKPTQPKHINKGSSGTDTSA